MNRKSILIWAMAIGTLSSCMSNEDMYDPEKAEAMKVAKYEAAFVKKYGKVDPKQDWGFGEAEVAMQAVTKVANCNSNEWSKSVEVPTSDDLTSEKVNTIVNLFKNPSTATVVESVDWSDFFVQFVYFNASRNMNQLAAYKGGRQGDGGQRDEVSNFNRNSGSIMLMQNSGTDDFSYYTEGGEYSEHIIIYYEGDYYVGLDFECYMNQNTPPDGDYSDWIVRIVPAKYKNARRIMAEDLSVDSKSDFDFNDVVFDAAIVGDEAVITLQAVGGTLPLCVGDVNHEVHDLFGVGKTEFVNTQSRGEKAPIMFRIPSVNSLEDIKIIVDEIDISAIQTGNKNMNVPAKLCCPINYKWADEKKSIDEFFPKFKDAVGNSDVLWYEDGTKEWQ